MTNSQWLPPSVACLRMKSHRLKAMVLWITTVTLKMKEVPLKESIRKHPKSPLPKMRQTPPIGFLPICWYLPLTSWHTRKGDLDLTRGENRSKASLMQQLSSKIRTLEESRKTRERLSDLPRVVSLLTGAHHSSCQPVKSPVIDADSAMMKRSWLQKTYEIRIWNAAPAGSFLFARLRGHNLCR